MDPIAHASVALMVKPITPKAPLWALIAATEVPDLLFFGFQALGIEHQAVTDVDFIKGTTYLSPALLPWSHGLLLCLFWSFVVGIISRIFIKDVRTSIVIGLLVFSHWALDALAYSNLPIGLDGSPQIGLGLVNSGIGMIIGIGIEVLLILGGVLVYMQYRRKKVVVKA